MPRYVRQKTLSVAQQAALLRAEWQSLSVATHGGQLEASGVLQPTPISAEYTVTISYRLGGSPEAYVHSPALARRPEDPEEPIPHVYPWRPGTEGRPCLYRPWSKEWHAGKPVARTIVPWLMTWLVNYEVWRATGKWLGGGADHRGPKSDYMRST